MDTHGNSDLGRDGSHCEDLLCVSLSLSLYYSLISIVAHFLLSALPIWPLQPTPQVSMKKV